MAVIDLPVTLPASKLMASITSLIGEVRFQKTITPSTLVTDIVERSRIGNVEFGKGIVQTTKVDLQDVKDLSENSSAFTISKPRMAQEVIAIDTYKFAPLSVSSILTKDAFLSGFAVEQFFAEVLDTLQDTKTFALYDVMLNIIQSWVPAQSTQTITVNLKDTSTLSGVDLKVTNELNANEIAKTIRKTVNSMRVLSNKYTDVAKYTAQDGSQKDVKTALRGDDLRVIMNDRFYTDIVADSIASLYHSDRIADMFPNGMSSELIPEDKMTDNKVICWISHPNKFALADFYNVQLSIVDPSTLYTNYFLHYAYGAGVFKYLPAVKVIANFE